MFYSLTFSKMPFLNAHTFIKMFHQKYHELIKQSLIFTAKLYIDKNLKRHSNGKADDFLCDIYHQSHLTKKELYAATTELQVGGVETVRFHNTDALSQSQTNKLVFQRACFRVTRE